MMGGGGPRAEEVRSPTNPRQTGATRQEISRNTSRDTGGEIGYIYRGEGRSGPVPLRLLGWTTECRRAFSVF